PLFRARNGASSRSPSAGGSTALGWSARRSGIWFPPGRSCPVKCCARPGSAGAEDPMIPARSSYRARSSAISASVSFALLLLLVATAGAAPVQITGRFFYQDRLWDGGGYTGTTQDLPIRHADIEIVNALNQGVVGVGRTGADGSYAITIDLFVTSNLYVRCSSATTRHPDYHIWVVDNF